MAKKRSNGADPLYIASLSARRVTVRNAYRCDAPDGTAEPGLVWLIRGIAVFECAFCRITAMPGDALFIPSATQFAVKRPGEAPAEYIHISFGQSKPSRGHGVFWDGFAMQRVAPLCGSAECEAAERICRAAEKKQSGVADRLSALSELYALLALAVPEMAPKRAYNRAVLAALDFIEAHFAENFSAAALARHCGISVSRLCHLFYEELSLTPVRCRNEARIRHSAIPLCTGKMTVTELSSALGFSSPSYFCKVFREITGTTPADCRNSALLG